MRHYGWGRLPNSAGGGYGTARIQTIYLRLDMSKKRRARCGIMDGPFA